MKNTSWGKEEEPFLNQTIGKASLKEGFISVAISLSLALNASDTK